MTWEQGLALASVAVTGLLGWITYRRGAKADDVLDVAANVKTTFEAQREFNDSLLADNRKMRADLNACEEGHDEDRRALAAAQREVARLKATVDEHEQTIAKHERRINELQAGQS